MFTTDGINSFDILLFFKSNTQHNTSKSMNKKYNCLIIVFFSFLFVGYLSASDKYKSENLGIPQYVAKDKKSENVFTIVSDRSKSKIQVDSEDWPGVIRAAKDLGADVQKVSGTPLAVEETIAPAQGSIIVGTIGKSRIIDQLIKEKKIDVTDIIGKWESFLIQAIDGNLIVVGSDKRGTIFGIYDISEKIGVSPWYWWADIPAKKSKDLYILNGRYVQESPKVKYRGIFINDEWPSFGGWATSKFGDLNSKMYGHLFELLLRLKANYFWPAMWNSAFNEDDPMNPVLADEYGIVMGTSHHEPMMRAHKEYTNRKEEVGAWNYATNKEKLNKFFFDGLNRNKNFENLITIGMRGDGDVALSEDGDESNMKVLSDVINGQRKIIGDVYQKDPAEVPQVWAIFTEVQRYYDAGFKVPEDVIMMFCDNNWGYIRRTVPPHEKGRSGGFGLYYHIDMNGGPWNDRWVNTTTIPKLREQFSLAYQSGLDALWIVNVGDLKPKELPIDFIMRYAWDPEAITENDTWKYTLNWAKQNFEEKYAAEIADIVSKYPKYNLWRKAEAQSTRIFSFVNHNEADSVLNLWHDLTARAEALEAKISPEYKDAYYQLVLYPTKASAGVAEIYLASGLNNLYAKQGRVTANEYSARARKLFALDQKLSDYYNGAMSAGKWKEMMSDKHIGYKQWYMPKENELPELIEVTPLNTPTIGVAVEGYEQAWSGSKIENLKLPVFDILKKQAYYIDIFNKGTGAFDFTAKTNKSWIKLNRIKGHVEKEIRIEVDIDWNLLPSGNSYGFVNIKQGSKVIKVLVEAVKGQLPTIQESYFGNFTGEFSIPAEKYNANVPGKHAQWIVLPDLGRSEACMGITPVTARSVTPENAPYLEYKIYLPKTGKNIICFGIIPTQDVYPQRGLRFATSLNNEKAKVIDARKGMVDTFGEYNKDNLAKSKVLKPLPPVNKEILLTGAGQHRRSDVFDNLRWLDVDFEVKEAGIQTLKIFMIDPEIVLERIVVNPDNRYPSYFGAPSIQHNVK